VAMSRRKASVMRMGRSLLAAFALILSGAGALHAQLLGRVGDVVGGVTQLPGGLVGGIVAPVGGTLRSAAGLAQERLSRLQGFARENRQAIELDRAGEPAVRGRIIAIDPDEATLKAAEAVGFVRASEERIEGLDIRSVTLRPPEGWTLARSLDRLRKIAPSGSFEADNIYFPSGAAAPAPSGGAVAGGSGGGTPIGLIDGGVARHPAITGPVEQRGFAAGAPAPSPHGTAVASLIAGTAMVRGAAPGAALLVADVYGRDPAGGGALAIARAIGWMTARKVPIVTVSLVGPDNALLARAVAAAAAKGTRIVAAVGNDGPAAPPAFPASYAQVIAVTGVDGRDRALIEAGRALHLDYAAPGADMAAADPNGRSIAVRGTSFAAPLVAGRLALLYRGDSALALAALDREARDLGKRGPDRVYGRGLICGECRTKLR